MATAEITKPAPGNTALVIIDMINPLSFEGSEALVESASCAGDAVERLRDQADRAKVPVVYVNDNFGEWHSERSRLVERCMDGPGGDLARKLRPRDEDFFVIKPQFSGFYATNLPVLLPKLEVSRLILTGIAADMCVLFTAADAHMRAYELWVPEDAVAGEDDQRTGWALDIMRSSMGAQTRSTAEMTLQDWLDAAGRRGE